MSPGYLSRQRLLGEHRELHGLVSILVNGKTGYSRHPETRRWVGCVSGLARRHAHLVAEFELRNYRHLSPLAVDASRPCWPEVFITSPDDQYELLAAKYKPDEHGRIPLPRNAQELWAHHKYSVMARDPAAYRALGRAIARMRRGSSRAPLAQELVLLLRTSPPRGCLVNAIEHMWGYVAKRAGEEERRAARQSPGAMLQATCAVAVRVREPYLVASTALSDLAASSLVLRSGPTPTIAARPGGFGGE